MVFKSEGLLDTWFVAISFMPTTFPAVISENYLSPQNKLSSSKKIKTTEYAIYHKQFAKHGFVMYFSVR